MKTAATIILSLLNAVAQAQNGAPSELARFSLTPFGGYTFGGRFSDAREPVTAETRDSPHVGLILDIRETANTQWELFYSRQRSEADLQITSPGNAWVDLDAHYLQLGGTWVADGDRARPFLAATLGATRFDPDPLDFDARTFFSFGVGAGWQLHYLDRVGFRLEARLLGTFLRSDKAFFCQTGPNENICAIAANSDLYWQFQTSAGLQFRF